MVSSKLEHFFVKLLFLSRWLGIGQIVENFDNSTFAIEKIAYNKRYVKVGQANLSPN